MKFRDFVDCV